MVFAGGREVGDRGRHAWQLGRKLPPESPGNFGGRTSMNALIAVPDLAELGRRHVGNFDGRYNPINKASDSEDSA